MRLQLPFGFDCSSCVSFWIYFPPLHSPPIGEKWVFAINEWHCCMFPHFLAFANVFLFFSCWYCQIKHKQTLQSCVIGITRDTVLPISLKKKIRTSHCELASFYRWLVLYIPQLQNKRTTLLHFYKVSTCWEYLEEIRTIWYPLLIFLSNCTKYQIKYSYFW